MDWTPPEPSRFEALLLTSGNAPAQAGPALQLYHALPCYCVGEATAAAARVAGLSPVGVGASDGAALLETMAADRVRTALHLCGRDHLPPAHPDVRLERRIVYAADPVAGFAPEAIEALAQGALALIHSPRAGRLFGEFVDRTGLVRTALRIAAISPAAAQAAGTGWESRAASASPRDEALLELAAKLCQTAPMGGAGQSE